MRSPDGRYAVTYNGEIYNFPELREELEQLGYRFRSRTDTEVLLHGYDAWGRKLLERLNGMFAFALWDETGKRLWLARDRLGIKPLFYFDDGSTLMFGSEIKAILRHPDITRRPDYHALHQFLTLNYTAAPATGFAGIRQLLPGEEMGVSEGGTLQRNTYWQIAFSETPRVLSENDAVEELEYHLDKAVRMRLLSDVPVGAFLSGGLDSSAIARAMRRQGTTEARTYSIGFEEKSFDELEFAQEVAQLLDLSHIGEKIRASAAELLPSIIFHHEEPTADSSSIAFGLLCRMARRHITVALSGDGADELLGGYETYRASLLANRFRTVPGWIRRGVIAPLVGVLPISHRRYSLESKLKRFVQGANQDTYPPHCCWRRIGEPDILSQLYTPEFLRASKEVDPLSPYAAAMQGVPDGLGPLAPLLAADTRFYLPNDMLVKVDRMSMAFGLEVRVPFLDHDLVEFCFSLDQGHKIGNGRETKAVLRRSLARDLPTRITARPKAGFNLPLGTWMQKDFQNLLNVLLLGGVFEGMGLLQTTQIERLSEEHAQGKRDHGHLLYGILCLGLWWQIWMTQERKVLPLPLM